MGKDETMLARYKRVLERAVKRGAAYLDANPDKVVAFEDWFRVINLNYLSLSSSSGCIIGQTLGDYGNLTLVDDFSSWSLEKIQRWAERRGFLVHDRKRRVKNGWYGMYAYEPEYIYMEDLEYRDEAYAYLTVLWTAEVESRQVAASLADSLTGTSAGS